MENYFYENLNRNAVEAVRRNTAFFMGQNDFIAPLMVDSYSGQPITGVNYFNLQLSNDVSGKRHTEYVKANEALSSNVEWLSTLPRENRPRGTLYQEEMTDSRYGYSFVMPTAELNQNVYQDNRARDNRARDNRGSASARNYVPFQSSNATMDNFGEFVHEQFTNAVNASLTGCPFKNNIRPHELEQFKTRLVDEISRNPAFMAMAADRAREAALNYHYLPFDRNRFIERARNENSPEFMRLNSAVNDHVHDMYRNRRSSFNPEFDALARPLVTNVERLYRGNPHARPAVDHEISGFVRQMIKQEKQAKVLADTFAGTFVEKAMKLVSIGKKVFTGIVIAGAMSGHINMGIAAPLVAFIHNIPEHFPPRQKVVVNDRVFQGDDLKKIVNFDNAPFSLSGRGAPEIRDYEMAHRAERAILRMTPAINPDEYRRDMTYRQVMNFCQSAAGKLGNDRANTRLDDSVNVADRIMAAQGMKGNNTLKTCRDRDNPRLFYACLNQTIRDNPRILDKAVCHVIDSRQNYKTQSMTKGQSMRR